MTKKSFCLKPCFDMIVGDRSRPLGSLVNSSAIVTIIWKPNFHFASNRQRSQRLPTIATITIAGIESESTSAIVNDRQRSQRVNGNHQCSDCRDRNDPSDHMEIIAQRSYVSCDLKPGLRIVVRNAEHAFDDASKRILKFSAH